MSCRVQSPRPRALSCATLALGANVISEMIVLDADINTYIHIYIYNEHFCSGMQLDVARRLLTWNIPNAVPRCSFVRTTVVTIITLSSSSPSACLSLSLSLSLSLFLSLAFLSRANCSPVSLPLFRRPFLLALSPFSAVSSPLFATNTVYYPLLAIDAKGPHCTVVLGP